VRAAGARIHNDTIAGTEVKYVDSDDGSRPIWGIKGCTIVLVFGMDHRLADRIAASVFKD
jgi:hypothetical protein